MQGQRGNPRSWSESQYQRYHTYKKKRVLYHSQEKEVSTNLNKKKRLQPSLYHSQAAQKQTQNIAFQQQITQQRNHPHIYLSRNTAVSQRKEVADFQLGP